MAQNLVTNLFGFVIVLGFLVFVHEAGHFLFAKLFRVRVLVFSFGFGKRLFGFVKGDTDYRVSLIPLGGYVKMAGDNPEENRTADPHEFLSRPKWQRFLILVAGPLMNLIIAIAFMTGFFMVDHEVLRESTPVLGSVVANQPAGKAGLRPGDEILRVNGEPMRTWADLKLAISMNGGSRITIDYRRDGKESAVSLVPAKQTTEYGVGGIIGITPRIETEIGKVVPDTAAARAGMKPGDRIVEVAGKPVTQLSEVYEAFTKAGKAAAVPLGVDRGGQVVKLTLPSREAAPQSWPGFTQPVEMRSYSFTGALRESFAQNARMVRYTFATLARMLRAEGSVKEFSGPIDIARISGEMLRTGFREVIFLMAVISLQLGIMNLLPFPVLDGGHIAILLVEGVARRDLSLAVKERIQQVGFVALAALMLVVIYNDVIKNVMLMKNG